MGVGTAQGHTCFLLDQWGRGLGPRLPPFALLPGVVDYLSKLHQRESLATVEKEEERASLRDDEERGHGYEDDLGC